MEPAAAAGLPEDSDDEEEEEDEDSEEEADEEEETPAAEEEETAVAAAAGGKVMASAPSGNRWQRCGRCAAVLCCRRSPIIIACSISCISLSSSQAASDTRDNSSASSLPARSSRLSADDGGLNQDAKVAGQQLGDRDTKAATSSGMELMKEETEGQSVDSLPRRKDRLLEPVRDSQLPA
jgi:hypothetical protein